MTDEDKSEEKDEQGTQFDEYPQLTGDEESVVHTEGDHSYPDKVNTGPIVGENNDDDEEKEVN